MSGLRLSPRAFTYSTQYETNGNSRDQWKFYADKLHAGGLWDLATRCVQAARCFSSVSVIPAGRVSMTEGRSQMEVMDQCV